MSIDKKLKKDTKIPRTFASAAYLQEVEKGTFQLFRDLYVMENGEKEKIGKPIPVGFPLREVEKGEEQRVVIKTVHPNTMKELHLVEVDPQRGTK